MDVTVDVTMDVRMDGRAVDQKKFFSRNRCEKNGLRKLPIFQMVQVRWQ